MPLPREHAAHINSAVEALLRAVTSLVDEVGTAVSSSARVHGAASGVAAASKDIGAAAKAKSAKLRRSLKAYWSKMKGKAREERIAKMLKGRGVKRKAK